MPLYHLRPDGTPGTCKAAPGACPLGGQHFQDREEAAQAAEVLLSAEHGLFVPQSREAVSGLTQAELSEKAKSSLDQDELIAVAEVGGKRALQNLRLNASAPGRALTLAVERLDDPTHALRFAEHPNYPLGSMTEEQVAHVDRIHTSTSDYAARRNWEKKLKGDEFGDRHLKVLMAADSYKTLLALENSNNQLTSEAIENAVATHPALLPHAAKHAAFDITPHIGGSDPVRAAALTTTPHDDARLALVKHMSERPDFGAFVEAIPYDTALSSADWGVIAAKGEGAHVAHRVWSSNDEAAISHMATRNSTMASLVRVRAANMGGQVDRMLVQGSEVTTRGSEVAYQFDTAALESKGLSGEDVDNYVKIFRGDYLFGATYDASTGVYKGYIN